MGRVFERELKGIFSGNTETLARVTKSCDSKEREGYYRILDRPFMVIRGAGSLGVDLVAVRQDLSFPIEVKSSTSDVLRFSRSEKLAVQAQQMAEDCTRVGLMPIYAFRHKRHRGDAWRIFTLDVGALNGRLKLIYSHVPKIAPSKGGNLIMRWEEGMPLCKFIDYVVMLSG